MFVKIAALLAKNIKSLSKTSSKNRHDRHEKKDENPSQFTYYNCNKKKHFINQCNKSC